MALADALAVLCTNGPMRMGELASLLRITPASTTRAVSCLVDMGFAQRIKDPTDQRSIVVSATPEGHDRFRVFSDRIQVGIEQILTEFNPEEQAALADLLERFARSVDRFVADQSSG